MVLTLAGGKSHHPPHTGPKCHIRNVVRHPRCDRDSHGLQVILSSSLTPRFHASVTDVGEPACIARALQPIGRAAAEAAHAPPSRWAFRRRWARTARDRPAKPPSHPAYPCEAGGSRRAGDRKRQRKRSSTGRSIATDLPDGNGPGGYGQALLRCAIGQRERGAHSEQSRICRARMDVGIGRLSRLVTLQPARSGPPRVGFRAASSPRRDPAGRAPRKLFHREFAGSERDQQFRMRDCRLEMGKCSDSHRQARGRLRRGSLSAGTSFWRYSTSAVRVQQLPDQRDMALAEHFGISKALLAIPPRRSARFAIP